MGSRLSRHAIICERSKKMAENSKIEWTTHTFNPWVGCQKVSPACEHCYAESWAKRTGQAGLWRGERRRTSASNWKLPLKWNKEAEGTGTRPRVFCSSLADVFEAREELVTWRDNLFDVIRATPNLDWLLLTKRPENLSLMLPVNWQLQPAPNVWLGTTVENQAMADKRIPELLSVRAGLHFLSCEPLLSPVHLGSIPAPSGGYFDARYTGNDKHRPAGKIDWVISGGESGGNARPSSPAWFRSLRDQCVEANVPFHFKQHGEWIGVDDLDSIMQPGETYQDKGWTTPAERVFADGSIAVRIGKTKSGRLLDGRIWDELPSN
jgi:protein gp37